MVNRTILICGPTAISDKHFEKFYVPQIEQEIQSGSNFVIGGALGVDYLAKCYLVKQNVDPSRVTVYDKGEQNHSVITIDGTEYKFNHINGFSSYPKRDDEMVKIADNVIGFVYQYGGGASGTIKSLLTMEEKKKGQPLTPNEIVSLIRNKTMDPFINIAYFIANGQFLINQKGENQFSIQEN